MGRNWELILVVLFFVFIGYSVLTASGPSDKLSENGISAAIHEDMNQERTNRGIDPLRYDSQLEQVAVYHSQYMANNSDFGHGGPGGETLGDRYDQHGINCAGGENIQLIGGELPESDEEVAAEITESLMQSRYHRENILRESYTRQGIGVEFKNNDSGFYIYTTQNFC